MAQSNFSFIAAEWPQIHEYALRAEEYAFSDPKAAGVYARNAAEQLVYHIYEIENFRRPQDSRFVGHTTDPQFTAITPRAVLQKLDLLRTRGNRAAHPGQELSPDAALPLIQELHHVMIWAAHSFSTQPDSIPLDADFDPKIAAARTPLYQDDLRTLAVKVQEEHQEFQRKLDESAARARALEEENEKLRAQIAEAQAAKTTVLERDYKEDQTRRDLIDEALLEAGWTVTTDDAAHKAEPEVELRDAHGTTRYADYVLWGSDGTPLAVIEAKRTSRSGEAGQEQARLYADALEAQHGVRPIIFYTNGWTTWIWEDRAHGNTGYPPRTVLSFLSHDDLQWRHQLRRRRQALAATPIKAEIVDRPYQERVIRAVGEHFTDKHRAALLVMATGTGKTRTVIALVDQMLRAGWIKRVLFLADRKALVAQAVNAFKEHLPEQPPINLLDEKDPDGRIYVSTYPTMLNQIDQIRDDGTKLYGPGFFDLVIVDEAHRSVYQKYRSIFEWFDSLLLGLTATPVDQVDRNTYQLFGHTPGQPTDAYSLDEAITDRYLVPARGLRIGTQFMDEGITYDNLSDEEKDAWDQLEWDENGEIPEAVNAAEINRRLFNTDTVDKVLAQLFEHGLRVAGGDTLGKTIIFAKNQAHADFIYERFNAQYPEHGGEFARVITHAVEHNQRLINNFGNRQPTAEPQIAITVDMLDTGIDVPEVLNLVFFKPVFSKTKFWQMVGRGTRTRKNLFGPGEHKTEFLILDVCGNLDFFNADVPEPERARPKTLTENIFEKRLELLLALHDQPQDEEAEGFRADLTHAVRVHVTGLNPHNVQVRPHRELVEHYTDTSPWENLTPEEAEELTKKLGPLPTNVLQEAEEAKSFDLTILRAQLALLTHNTAAFAAQRNKIQDIADGLLTKTTIPEVRAQAALLETIREDVWWTDATHLMLEDVRRKLRGLIALVDKTRWKPVRTSFEDTLTRVDDVDIQHMTPGTNPRLIRDKAERFLRQNLDNIAVQKLRHNKQLTDQDVEALEQLLVEAGVGTREDIQAAIADSEGLGIFLRSLVGLDRAAVQEAFTGFIRDADFSADQLRFINQIIDYLTANGSMSAGQLFDSPFTDYGQADDVIGEERMPEVISILDNIRRRATPLHTALSDRDAG